MPDILDRLQRGLAGRYQVERELTQGGMGTIFLAADPTGARQLAIKVLSPQVANKITRERFL